MIDTSPRYNQVSLVVVRLISLQNCRTPCVIDEQATSIPHDPRILVVGEESSCIRFKVVVRLKTCTCSTYCSKSPHVDSHHCWQQSGWTPTIAGRSPGWTSNLQRKPKWTPEFLSPRYPPLGGALVETSTVLHLDCLYQSCCDFGSMTCSSPLSSRHRQRLEPDFSALRAHCRRCWFSKRHTNTLLHAAFHTWHK